MYDIYGNFLGGEYMKRVFYNILKEKLKENKEFDIVTIIKSNDTNKVGKKILKINNEWIIEDKSNLEFYQDVANKINFNESGRKLKINDDTEIIIEHMTPKSNIVICGGGHIALELSKVAKMLDFTVTVIDDRKEFANKERFPFVDKIICNNFEDSLGEVSFNSNSYFVIVTRGHRDDQVCLETILKNKFKYLGMIGSKAKVANSIRQLLEKGYTTEEINKINAPVGLNIGAKTPAEIAISIAAEIIKVKNEKNISSIDDEILKNITQSEKKMVLASILDKRGSSPRGIDAKMLVMEDGTFTGTIGGGSVENAVYEKAIELIKEKSSHIETYDLSNTVAAKLGMACGGTIKVLFEYIE